MANKSRETANLVSITGISTLRTEFNFVNGPVQIGSAVTITAGGIVAGLSTITNFRATHINATGVGTFTGAIVGSAVTITSGGIVVGLSTVNNFNATHINISGVTTVAAGSTAAPSISPTGDSNTGIFFPAADTIAFGEGGSEAARIDSAGNILIGAATSTETASQPLQVTGGAYVSGSVGIGTTNPTVKLQVLTSESGSFNISAAPNSATSTVSIQNTLGDAVLFLGNDNQVSAGLGTLANNGGVINFGGKLSSSSTTGNRGFGAIGAYKENNTSGNQQGYLSLYSRPSTGNLAERVRIDSSGNVGIADTNPAYKLSVTGTCFLNGASVQGATVSIGAVNPTTKTITITSGNSDSIYIVASAYTSGGTNSVLKSFIAGGYMPGVAGQYSAATVASATTGSGLAISDITKATGSFSFTMTLTKALNSQGEVSVISRYPVTIAVS